MGSTDCGCSNHLPRLSSATRPFSFCTLWSDRGGLGLLSRALLLLSPRALFFEIQGLLVLLGFGPLPLDPNSMVGFEYNQYLPFVCASYGETRRLHDGFDTVVIKLGVKEYRNRV